MPSTADLTGRPVDADDAAQQGALTVALRAGDADDLAGPDVRWRPARTRGRSSSGHLEPLGAIGCGRGLRVGNSSSVGAPTMSSTISSISQLPESKVPWITPSRITVSRSASRWISSQPVADVDDGGALVARLLDDLLELCRVAHVQRGRGLVEHQHQRAVSHRPGDFEELPCPGPSAPTSPGGSNGRSKRSRISSRSSGGRFADGVEGQLDVLERR